LNRLEQLRNQSDYRLHVLCEARALIRRLPEDSARNAVLAELWHLISADMEISMRLLYSAGAGVNRRARAAP
jgi:hypothetical protein